MKKIILITIFAFLFFPPITGLCADAIVLKYSTNIDVSAKKCIQTKTVIIQINNTKGDKYSNFNIGYSDSYKLKKLTGEIRDLNSSTIRKLTNKDIKTTSSFDYSTFYNDNFVKRFSLKHNRYPYIVEVEFQHEISPYIYVANWFPLWDTDISTKAADLIVTFPAGFEFKINDINIGLPEMNETEKGKTYKWTSSFASIKTDDIFAPSLIDSLPSVSIVPLYFNYIKPGSFESWKAMGEWKMEIDKGLDNLTDKEKMTIDQITNGINDTRKIISVLYHYLQDNTRYVNVNIELGGLEPYPASYVCDNRFGDCKALTNYMKAMLSYKGISSNKVFVHAGDIPEKIHTEFPSQQSNHVILALPLTNDTIWLECTSNYLPVNYLGSFTQNRPVLWIEPNNSRIILSPALKKEEVTSILSYKFSSNEINQTTKLTASFKLRGEPFEKVTSIMKNWSEKDKRDYFNSFLGFKNFQAEHYQVIPTERDSCFIDFETMGVCNSPYQTVGEYIKVELPSLHLPVFEKVKDRQTAVNIYMPLAQIDTLTYDLTPATFELETLDNILIESSFGKFEMKTSSQNGQINVVRKYIIPTQIIPFEKYKDFYDFISEMKVKGGSVFIKTSKK